MLAKVVSCAVIGLDGAIIEIETDISPGLPSFTIVGLPDTAVQEARERVRAAVRNSGSTFPVKRIVANLAPASLKKAGPAYDLPLALGILLSSEQITADVSEMVVLGELSLDGSLRHTNGILPMVALARERGFGTVVVPRVNAREAALVSGIRVIPVATLSELADYLKGEIPEPVLEPAENPPPQHAATEARITNLAYVKGQEHVKRALEVAASGGHNIILMGPPGSGKTMLARALPAILPPLADAEALDITRIYSVSGLLPPDASLITERPFRAPHYTISNAGLVGGGRLPRPGEISLSHHGVLFLDELPEFGHAVLELLRQPLEDKIITISRAQGSLTFPANFMLVGAMNPCPCGYYGDPGQTCTCSNGVVARYQHRISGPFIDRVDIFVEVPHIEYEKLADETLGEPSERVQQRVAVARERQRQRFAGTPLGSNADMTPHEVREFCRLDATAQDILQTPMKQLHCSARAFHRVLKLARTIADLAGTSQIEAHHLAEAIQYRPRRIV